MTSNDNFVTVEMFNNGIHEIKLEMQQLRHEIQETRTELKTEMLAMRNEIYGEIKVNRVDISHVQTSVYWGLAIIAIVIALVGLNPSRREKREESKKQNFATIEQVQEIVDNAITKALSNIKSA